MECPSWLSYPGYLGLPLALPPSPPSLAPVETRGPSVLAPGLSFLMSRTSICLLDEGLGGVELVLMRVKGPFPAQGDFLSPPTSILLFLAQEKAYFPHEVTVLAAGSS